MARGELLSADVSHRGSLRIRQPYKAFIVHKRPAPMRNKEGLAAGPFTETQISAVKILTNTPWDELHHPLRSVSETSILTNENYKWGLPSPMSGGQKAGGQPSKGRFRLCRAGQKAAESESVRVKLRPKQAGCGRFCATCRIFVTFTRPSRLDGRVPECLPAGCRWLGRWRLGRVAFSAGTERETGSPFPQCVVGSSARRFQAKNRGGRVGAVNWRDGH
jgi:hypothetical protein